LHVLLGCPPGTFGYKCSDRCHCDNGQTCTNDHGICPDGCLDGYHGPQCNIPGKGNVTYCIEGKRVSTPWYYSIRDIQLKIR